ncbi:MAG: hypothetical protein R3C20_21810 [Planctomycetaceae bacterium]
MGHYFVVRPRDRATKTRRTDRERTLDSLNFRPLKWTPTTTDELRDAFGNFRGVRRRIDLWTQTQLVNAQIQSGDQRQILVFDVIRDDDELDATGTESTFVWIVDQGCQFEPVHVMGFGQLPLFALLRPLAVRLFNYSFPHPSLEYSCCIFNERGRFERRPFGANLVSCLENLKPDTQWPFRSNLGFDFVLNGAQFLMWRDQLVLSEDMVDFVRTAEAVHAAAKSDTPCE